MRGVDVISVKVTGIISSADFKKAVEQATEKSINNVAEKFGKVVATSSGLDVLIEKSGTKTTVGVSGDKWPMLVRGRKSLVVKPVRARVLAFPAKYTRKTIPNKAASRQGGPSGPIVFSRGHTVGPVEPGNWPTVFADEERPILFRNISLSLKQLCR